MRSMTGFGQGTAESERYAVSVKMRAVNHRYLEIRTHLPEDLRGSESALRDALGQDLFRGRVDVSVEARPLMDASPRVVVDRDVARACSETAAELASAGWLAGGVRFSDLMRVPGAVQVETGAPDWREEDEAILLRVATSALEELVGGRRLEGGKLREILSERIAGLRVLEETLSSKREEVRARQADHLRERLTEILGNVPVDEGRLLQEVAVLSERADIAEELDRLRSHLDHFDEVMGQSGSIGKRLDFLTQEIFRELNTLGSKARNVDLTRGVLDSKVLCEQLREQVQNVE